MYDGPVNDSVVFSSQIGGGFRYTGMPSFKNVVGDTYFDYTSQVNSQSDI